MGWYLMVKLDDTNIEVLDLCLADRPEIPTAEQDVNSVEIRGRHGSLTKKYAYKDIEYPLTFNFLEDVSFKRAFRKAKVVIFNAKKLFFEDDPDVYYKIKSLTIEDAGNEILEFGQFTVNFILDPFQYEINNPVQTITDRTVITNEGYESEPIMTVHCAGNGKVYVNDIPITIQNINGTITIDSEMMNAYRKENGLITNLNNHMIGDFPVLEHGDNIIDFDGDISKIELIKNWRWV